MVALSLQRALERVARLSDGCAACEGRLLALVSRGAAPDTIRQARQRLARARALWARESRICEVRIEDAEVAAVVAGRLPGLSS